jgi:hypothetical protein
MNKKAKDMGGILVLLVLLGAGYYVFFYNGGIFGTTQDYTEIKNACIESGGEWTPTVTYALNYGGYSCSCSSFKNLEKMGEICKVIPQSEIDQCSKTPTVNMVCTANVDFNRCRCVDTGGNICNFQFSDVAHAARCISDGKGNCQCEAPR